MDDKRGSSEQEKLEKNRVSGGWGVNESFLKSRGWRVMTEGKHGHSSRDDSYI